MKQIVKSIYLLAILAIFIGFLSPSARIAPPVPRAHPLLLSISANTPEQMVSVIVQKMAASGEAERLARFFGGRITKELRIINAFAVELPASMAVELATSPAVRWVSLDATVERAAKPAPGTSSMASSNFFLDTVNVRPVWANGSMGQAIQGKGVAVAVIDSGISKDSDFSLDLGHVSASRISKQRSFNPDSSTVNDTYGHGTHVAGIIGGNGYASGGVYSGIAPIVDLVSLKISDKTGMAYESDLVEALQWVYDNWDAYDIRVVNLSVNSTIEQSYHTSPVDAAVEILWSNGIVVIASSGNKVDSSYNTANAAPANDPFIITVGASDEKGTPNRADDIIASFSAFGTTMDGFGKPDIIAPGTNIISVLSKNSSWEENYPSRTLLNGEYFRLSGTSMAAAMVTGAVALLLQDEPGLNPDQVKFRLIQTTGLIGSESQDSYYPYLDVYLAVTGTTTESANTGQVASRLLWSGSEPVTWTSVAWNSVAWGSVAWGSDYWGN